MADYITDKIEYNSNIYKFQDNVSGYTKNIGTVTNVNLNGTSIATSGAVQLAIAQLTNIIYPVGCYYETSDSNFNPQTAWGGTWELEEEGITHIGANNINNPIVGASISDNEGTFNGTTNNMGIIEFNNYSVGSWDDYPYVSINASQILYTDAWINFMAEVFNAPIAQNYRGSIIVSTVNGDSFFITVQWSANSSIGIFQILDVEAFNLLDNPIADAGQSHTTYNVADFNFNTSLVAGQMYTVTAKINTSSEKKSIGFYHSGGSYYMVVPNTYAWLPINDSGIYSVTFVATDEMAAQTSGSGHGFCRVYVSNNENGGQGSTTVTGTANVDWIIVEEGCRLGAIGGNTLTTYKPNYTVANHTLTLTEMPSHTHTASKQGYSFTLGSYQTATSSTGSLAGVVTASTNVTGTQATGISSIFPRTSQTAGMSYLTINSAHKHTSYGKDGGHNHNFVGSSTSVSTMQPYVVVNRWHRTA